MDRAAVEDQVTRLQIDDIGMRRDEPYMAADECGSDLPPWAQAHITRPEQSKPVLGLGAAPRVADAEHAAGRGDGGAGAAPTGGFGDRRRRGSRHRRPACAAAPLPVVGGGVVGDVGRRRAAACWAAAGRGGTGGAAAAAARRACSACDQRGELALDLARRSCAARRPRPARPCAWRRPRPSAARGLAPAWCERRACRPRPRPSAAAEAIEQVCAVADGRVVVALALARPRCRRSSSERRVGGGAAVAEHVGVDRVAGDAACAWPRAASGVRPPGPSPRRPWRRPRPARCGRRCTARRGSRPGPGGLELVGDPLRPRPACPRSGRRRRSWPATGAAPPERPPRARPRRSGGVLRRSMADDVTKMRDPVTKPSTRSRPPIGACRSVSAPRSTRNAAGRRPRDGRECRYSHSMVPGGLEVMS